VDFKTVFLKQGSSKSFPRGPRKQGNLKFSVIYCNVAYIINHYSLARAGQ